MQNRTVGAWICTMIVWLQWDPQKYNKEEGRKADQLGGEAQGIWIW